MNNTTKKVLGAVSALVLAVTTFVVGAPMEQAQAADTQTTIMYRMYNRISGEHLYTKDANEVKVLSRGDWNYEGVAWVAPKESSTPVYRLYNPGLGDHHYTIDANEVKTLTREYGWRNEGKKWYSDDSKNTPIYRQYNPGLRVG